METSSNAPNKAWPEWPLIEGQLELVKRLWSAAKVSPSKSHSPLFPLLDAIQESTETLVNLARNSRDVRDAYVIARVVYETAVNACFILAKGEAIAERAWRHARQKSLRDLDRIVQVADKTLRFRWSGADQALSDPENQRLLQEFTSSSGRELSAWTPESIRERVDVVCQRFGYTTTEGMIYGLLLYRHSSEIAHGTLFGALFVYGATDPSGPPRSIETLQAFRTDQFRLILMLIGFSISSLTSIVGSELSQADIVTESQRIETAFRSRPRNETTPNQAMQPTAGN